MVTLFIPQIMDEWENEWSYTVKSTSLNQENSSIHHETIYLENKTKAICQKLLR